MNTAENTTLHTNQPLIADADAVKNAADTMVRGIDERLERQAEDIAKAVTRAQRRSRGKTIEELLGLEENAPRATSLTALRAEARKLEEELRAEATPEEKLPPRTYDLTTRQIVALAVTSFLGGIGATVGGTMYWNRRQARKADVKIMPVDASTTGDSSSSDSSPTMG